MQNLIHGLSALGSGGSLIYLFGGALLGMIVGVIPGLSTVVILSIILVFVPHIDITGTLCLFLGAQCGSFYSASVSAILLNTPAHPEAFPITFDGYPMARNGQPGRALGLSACATCVGGFIGCGILFGFLQIINYLPGVFHPPEYVALVTLAMLLVGTLGTNSVGKAVASAGAGLMLASIGPSAITGTFRYTFGALGLYSGVSLVALALGVFAVPQMVMVFGTGTTAARQDMTGQEVSSSTAVVLTSDYAKQLVGGILETFQHWVVLIQSGIVGGLTGIIPGIGGFTGNFLAYGIAKQTSRKRDLYGTGIPDGIIAPEGSSLAKEAGHIIPIIGLGIPGGVAGALFIGALSIKNLRVGYGFQSAYPNLSGEIVWIIALSGLIGTVAGVLIGPQLAKITRVPGPLIVPFILALCVSGAFLTDMRFFSVIEVVVFGAIGLGFRRLGYPLGSFILGLVLGPTFEANISLTHNIYPGFSFIAHRPLADGIFAIAIVVLVSKAIELHNSANKRRVVLAAELIDFDDELMRAEAIIAQRRRLTPFPLLSLVMDLFLLTVSLYFVTYGVINYNFATATMPVIGGVAVALPALLFLPRDIRHYVLHRKVRSQTPKNPKITDAELLDRTPMPTDVVQQNEGGIMSALPSSDFLAVMNSTLAISPYGTSAIRDKSWGHNGQYRRELLAFIWLFGLVGACWLLGFEVGAPLFMAAYGITCTRRFLGRFRYQFLYTVASTAVVWLITYEMFHLTHLVFVPKVTL